MTTLRFVPHKYKVFRLELASSILYRCLHRPSFLILGFLTRASTQRPYRSRPVALGVEIVEGWEVRARTTTKENGKHKMPFDGQGLTTKVVPSFCTFVDSGECTLCAIFLYFRRLRGMYPMWSRSACPCSSWLVASEWSTGWRRTLRYREGEGEGGEG